MPALRAGRENEKRPAKGEQMTMTTSCADEERTAPARADTADACANGETQDRACIASRKRADDVGRVLEGELLVHRVRNRQKRHALGDFIVRTSFAIFLWSSSVESKPVLLCRDTRQQGLVHTHPANGHLKNAGAAVDWGGCCIAFQLAISILGQDVRRRRPQQHGYRGHGIQVVARKLTQDPQRFAASRRGAPSLFGRL